MHRRIMYTTMRDAESNGNDIRAADIALTLHSTLKSLAAQTSKTKYTMQTLANEQGL